MKSLAVLFACLVLGVVPVLGQQPPTLSTLTVALWPEFDRPELLVMYSGEFDASTPLPIAAEFRIPAAAVRPSAVAYVDEQGELIQQAYATRDEDDWIVVTMDLPSRGFRFEYYLPITSTQQEIGQRLIPFTYSADYAITTLNFEVQEPLNVRAFTLDPAAGSAGRRQDGLNYHTAQRGPIAQNDLLRWTIRYDKIVPGLTIDAFEPAATATPAAATVAEKKRPAGLLVALAGVLALVAVGGGAFWLGTRSRTEASPPRSQRTAGRPRAARGEGQAAAGAFCYKCGAQLRADADFCHRCGATARKPGTS